MSTTNNKKYALGTGSAIKINAAKRAFAEDGVEIVPVIDAPSGVSSQPIGKEETRRGAINRARAAQKAQPSCHAFIGIENGMWKIEDDDNKNDKKENGDNEEQKWEDAAIVVMIIPAEIGMASEEHDFIIEAFSDALEIPPKDKRPFEGGRNGEWSVLKDPHAVLTGGKKPREEFLFEALTRLNKKVPRKR